MPEGLPERHNPRGNGHVLAMSPDPNSVIASSQLLGPQYEIGHAYFLDIVPLLIDDLDKRRRQGYLWNTKGAPRRPVEQLWDYALFPLLQEYLVSIDPQSRAKVLGELRKAFVSEPVAEA